MPNPLDNLSPNHKRIGVIVLGISLLYVILAMNQDDNKDPHSEVINPKDNVIDNILTTSSTRQVGLENLAANIKMLREEIHQIDKKVGGQDRRVSRLETHQPNPVSYERQLAQLNSKVSKMAQQSAEDQRLRDDLQKRVQQLQGELFNLYENGVGSQRFGTNEAQPIVIDESPEVQPVVQQAPPPTETENPLAKEFAASQPSMVEFEQPAAVNTAPTDLVFEDVTEKVESSEAGETNSEENPGIVIPLGSIITGRLINGLDAPVSDAARRDPFPVTLVVKKEALLPNFHTVDIRHCHINMSGYGDISSERVMLRTEGISCVTEDGIAVETSMKGYATGEDGKAGVRGRLRERQGQMIAKSLLGSTISGFAKAFAGVPIPIVDTSPGADSNIDYASQLTHDALNYGVAQGVSEGADSVARFYLNWAEKIFPILELDAGREIDINVSSGFVLPVPSRS
jgi:conjugal transfer pilus assembly protein TraB